MESLNCWEYKECGREVGGTRAQEVGVCPAALPGELDGTNNGRFAGRVCWAVAGTLCDGETAGSSAQNLATCLDCEFLNRVHNEESRHFVLTPIHHCEFSLKEH